MKLKKTCITSMLLALVCSFTACKGLAGGAGGGGGLGGGGGKVDNTVEDTKTLKIMAINKGYGVEWLNKIIEAFEAEYAADGVDVVLSTVSDASAIATSIESGAKLNDVDLYFDVNTISSYARYLAYQNKWGYPQGMLDLTDVYNANVPGEDITFKDKMNDSVLDKLYAVYPFNKFEYAIPHAYPNTLLML